jgi:hypothetical protein
VKAITDRPDPETPCDKRSIVSLMGVYCSFVPDIESIAVPLPRLVTASLQVFDSCRTDSTRWAAVMKAIDYLMAAMICCPALSLPEIGN